MGAAGPRAAVQAVLLSPHRRRFASISHHRSCSSKLAPVWHGVPTTSGQELVLYTVGGFTKVESSELFIVHACPRQAEGGNSWWTLFAYSEIKAGCVFASRENQSYSSRMH